jgi:hypothetical protein
MMLFKVPLYFLAETGYPDFNSANAYIETVLQRS